MTRPDTTRTISPTSGLLAASRKIAEKRAKIVEQMASALKSDNVAAVLELARQLCGVTAVSQKARVQ